VADPPWGCFPRTSSLRMRKLDKRCAHRADGAPRSARSRFRMSRGLGAGERIRTADRPLTRRIRSVAEHRRMWPHVPPSCGDHRWKSPSVAGRLPTLAPRLAPPGRSSGRRVGYKSVASQLGARTVAACPPSAGPSVRRCDAGSRVVRLRDPTLQDLVSRFSMRPGRPTAVSRHSVSRR
jgi:hypothetical protein